MTVKAHRSIAIALIATIIAPLALAQASDETSPDPKPSPQVESKSNAPNTGISPQLARSVTLAFSRDTTIADARSTTFSARDRTLAVTEARVQAADKALTQLRAAASELRGEARSKLDDAVANVRARQGVVSARIREARDATPNQFNEKRDALVESLEVYAETISELESVALAHADTP
jgi:hypothetical protein